MGRTRKHFTALAAFIIMHRRRRRARLRMRKVLVKRRWWVRPWLQRHDEQGYFNNLMVELVQEDTDSFKDFARMFPGQFAQLMDTDFLARDQSVCLPAHLSKSQP